MKKIKLTISTLLSLLLLTVPVKALAAETAWVPSNLNVTTTVDMQLTGLGMDGAQLADFTTTAQESGSNIAVTRDGNTAYIGGSINGSNQLHVVNLLTQTIVDTITLPGGSDLVWGLTLSNDESKLYVGNYGDNTLYILDTATNTIADTVDNSDNADFFTPQRVAVAPNNDAWVINHSSGHYRLFKLNATNTITAGPFHAPDSSSVAGDEIYRLGQAEVSKDGSKVYMTCTVQTSQTPDPDTFTSSVCIYDIAGNSFSHIADTSISENPSFESWGFEDLALSPDGTRLYKTNYDANSVSVVDTATDSVVTTIAVGDSPAGIDISADGSRVFVVQSRFEEAVASSDFTLPGQVNIINTENNSSIQTVTLSGVIPFSVGRFIGGFVAPVLPNPSSQTAAQLASTGTSQLSLIMIALGILLLTPYGLIVLRGRAKFSNS